MKEKKEHEEKAPTDAEKALALLERIALAVEFLAGQQGHVSSNAGTKPEKASE